jgi:CysZ protein
MAAGVGSEGAVVIPRSSRRRSLAYGLGLPYTAARLIVVTPSLLFWSLLPVLLTLFLYVYLIATLQDWALDQVRAAVAGWGWDPGGWIVWTVSLVSGLLLVLVGALTFTFASTVVSSPFNDLLAERAERWATPPLPLVERHGLAAQARLVWIDLLKSVAATVAGFAAVLFSWVPLLNVAAVVAVCLLVCFQYTSYPQTRRQERLGAGVRFLWRHAWACAGFGATITLLYAVPFVSSLALPVAVVGGTLLVARARGGAGLPSLR